MSIFDYKHFCDPKDIQNDPTYKNCPFCNTVLEFVKLRWDLPHLKEVVHTTIVEEKERMVRIYKHFHSEHNESYFYLNMSTRTEDYWLNVCNACGWWRWVIDVTLMSDYKNYVWHLYFGQTGVLKPMDLRDISTPISEIRQYLTLKYEERFNVNPHRFEEVVADVFRNEGCNVHATGYSNDGGIDMVLVGTDDIPVGVQVKRYKGKIKVEQIRAFAGALLLAGHKRGIFVTTSDFQPAAIKAAEIFSTKTLPIELINAERFYDALKITQRQPYRTEEMAENSEKIVQHKVYHYDYDARLW